MQIKYQEWDPRRKIIRTLAKVCKGHISINTSSQNCKRLAKDKNLIICLFGNLLSDNYCELFLSSLSSLLLIISA